MYGLHHALVDESLGDLGQRLQLGKGELVGLEGADGVPKALRSFT